MVLQKLSLQNFRSFKKAFFEFSPDITLIVGPNASGKTNILEAIFLLATGKTFRPGLERGMIRFGEEVGRVRGRMRKLEEKLEACLPAGRVRSENKDENSVELEVVLTVGEVSGKPTAFKKCFVNGVSKRQQDFVGNLNVVMFGPEDLELVTNSPSLRRTHLDFVLEQVDGEYRRRSLAYNKALSQRNKLLKLIDEGRRRKEELEYWDRLIVENGSYITGKRQEFFEFINSQPKELGNFRFLYQPSVFSARGSRSEMLAVKRNSRSHLTNFLLTCSQLYKERLEKEREKEIAAGMTLIGPHRDDMKFKIKNQKSEIKNGGRDLTIFGSRGEQRTAVLVLKLSELEFMGKVSGGRPVLLLDDIFSELDRTNRREVLRVIPKQQTIITTTDLGLVEKKFLDKTKVIELSKIET